MATRVVEQASTLSMSPNTTLATTGSPRILVDNNDFYTIPKNAVFLEVSVVLEYTEQSTGVGKNFQLRPVLTLATELPCDGAAGESVRPGCCKIISPPLISAAAMQLNKTYTSAASLCIPVPVGWDDGTHTLTFCITSEETRASALYLRLNLLAGVIRAFF
jgi:hypothetical protein